MRVCDGGYRLHSVWALDIKASTDTRMPASPWQLSGCAFLQITFLAFKVTATAFTLHFLFVPLYCLSTPLRAVWRHETALSRGSQASFSTCWCRLLFIYAKIHKDVKMLKRNSSILIYCVWHFRDSTALEKQFRFSCSRYSSSSVYSNARAINSPHSRTDAQNSRQSNLPTSV